MPDTGASALGPQWAPIGDPGPTSVSSLWCVIDTSTADDDAADDAGRGAP